MIRIFIINVKVLQKKYKIIINNFKYSLYYSKMNSFYLGIYS